MHVRRRPKRRQVRRLGHLVDGQDNGAGQTAAFDQLKSEEGIDAKQFLAGAHIIAGTLNTLQHAPVLKVLQRAPQSADSYFEAGCHFALRRQARAIGQAPGHDFADQHFADPHMRWQRSAKGSRLAGTGSPAGVRLLRFCCFAHRLH